MRRAAASAHVRPPAPRSHRCRDPLPALPLLAPPARGYRRANALRRPKSLHATISAVPIPAPGERPHPSRIRPLRKAPSAGAPGTKRPGRLPRNPVPSHLCTSLGRRPAAAAFESICVLCSTGNGASRRLRLERGKLKETALRCPCAPSRIWHGSSPRRTCLLRGAEGGCRDRAAARDGPSNFTLTGPLIQSRMALVP